MTRLKRIWSYILKYRMGTLIIVLLFLGLWEFCAHVGFIHPYIWEVFTPPTRILQDAIKCATSPTHTANDLWFNLGFTIYRLMVGFLIGSLLGVLTGLAIGWWKIADSILTPVIEFVRPIPMLMLFPIFLLLFGVGSASKIATAAVTVFFVVVINSMYGARSVDRLLVYSMRTMGANSRQIFSKAVLPSALPYIATGLRISVITSLLVIVATEMIQGFGGLGYMIDHNASTMHWSYHWVALASCLILGLILMYGWKVLEGTLLKWHREITARGE